ncbi:MAG TPA: coenzyme F420-0:L-glutamate ligase, partial [Acidimicrobiales bacterium]|nr:coenzyme F420-0:L-glutamate ligase [Acidimicrobiales bacterium]
MTGALTLLPVTGLPEIVPGDVLAEVIAAHADLQDGDVVVVTQKVVSKAEDRLVPVAGGDREAARPIIEAEAARV